MSSWAKIVKKGEKRFWHFLKFFESFWQVLGVAEEAGINMSISKYRKCMQKYPKIDRGWVETICT